MSFNSLEANKHKEIGNDFFKQEKFEQAISQYTKAWDLDSSNLVHLLNRSYAYLKLRKYNNCITDCENFFSRWKEKQNQSYFAKALFRMGSAHFGLSNFLDSKWCFDFSCHYQYNPSASIELAKAIQKLSQGTDITEFFSRNQIRNNEFEQTGKLMGNVSDYSLVTFPIKKDANIPFRFLFCQHDDMRCVLRTLADVVTQTESQKGPLCIQIHVTHTQYIPLARNMILLMLASSLDKNLLKEKISDKKKESRTRHFESIFLFVSVWSNFRISKDQYSRLGTIIDELIAHLSGNQSTLAWIQLSKECVDPILFILRRWRNFVIDPKQKDMGLEQQRFQLSKEGSEYYYTHGHLEVSETLKKWIKDSKSLFSTDSLEINPTWYDPFSEMSLLPIGPFQAVDSDFCKNTNQFWENLILHFGPMLIDFATNLKNVRVSFACAKTFDLPKDTQKAQFDAICTTNLGDYMGMFNLGTYFLPFLKKDGILYTQYMMGYDSSFLGQIERETGIKGITKSDFTQIMKAEIEPISISGTAAFRWKRIGNGKTPNNVSNMLIKMIQHITSNSTGGQRLMDDTFAALTKGQFYPQYTIFGFLRVVQSISQNCPGSLDKIIDKLLKNESLVNRKLDMLICAEALDFYPPLWNTSAKFAKSNLKRHILTFKDLNGTLDPPTTLSGKKEPHFMGILFRSKGDYQLALKKKQETLNKYLETVKIHKIDIHSLSLYTRLVEIILPDHYVVNNGQDDSEAYQFTLLDFRYGEILTAPIQFYRMQKCDVCKKVVKKIKTCGNCYKSAYCSKECQEADWDRHSQHCE